MKPANWIESIVRDAAARVVRAGKREVRERSRRRAGWVSGWKPEELERRVLLSSAIIAFGAQQTFGVGASPTAVSVADLNRDGKPDVVVANQGGNSVSVLLGNGDGTFMGQVTYGVSGSPSGLVVADVNGDGKPDLVVSNSTENVVDVFLGNGDGTFGTPATFATGNGPMGVATSDLNRDGKLDLLYVNHGDNTLGVMLGNGDGTFQSQATFTTGAGPVSLGVGDPNGDGKPDVAVANYTASTLSVLLGNGDGTFAPQQTYSTFGQPRAVMFAFGTGTSNPDLAYISTNEEAILTIAGNGDGTFQGKGGLGTFGVPRSVAFGDVDGNGKQDLVYADSTRNVVTVDPSISFGGPSFATGTTPYDLAVADVNGDGRQDIVVTNRGDNTISVLLGDVPPRVMSINRANPADAITGDSSVTYTVTFNEPVTGVDISDFTLSNSGVTATSLSIAPVSSSVYDVTIGGVSGLGTLTLSLTDDGSIKDAAGNPLQPGGDIVSFTSQFVPVKEVGAESIASADINGDGNPDLIVAAEGAVSVILGNGNGTFMPPVVYQVASGNNSVVVADINGDGKPDLVVAGGGAPFSILLGNGNGTFQSPLTYAISGSVYSMVASDVNGDGRTDLILAQFTANPINPWIVGTMLGNGNGTFQTQKTLAIASEQLSGESIAVGDVNGDGRLDLAVSNQQTQNVSVFLGNGDGTFGVQQTFAVGVFPGAIAMGDVNRDGKLDLVVGCPSSVSVLLGNGDGTFQAQRTVLAPQFYSLAVADMNGDGIPDIATTSSYGAGILLGNGDGTFLVQQTIHLDRSNFRAPRIAVSDVNLDGRPDLVVAFGSSTNGVEVLLGNSNGSGVGQSYQIIPNIDTINAGSRLNLALDADGAYIDLYFDGTPGGVISGRVPIDDPAGLTINSSSGNFQIGPEYLPSSGNFLPDVLHLNGTFTINYLAEGNPFADKTMDIGQSTVYIGYYSAATDPIGRIRAALTAGYNNGAWNGTNSAPAGVITSASAAQNPSAFSIGYADSADGSGIDTMPNTIELKYTVAGDANLDGKVTLADFSALASNFGTQSGASWSEGDFTYDGAVTLADFGVLAANFGEMLPAVIPAVDLAPQDSSGPEAIATNLSEPALSQTSSRESANGGVTPEAVVGAASVGSPPGGPTATSTQTAAVATNADNNSADMLSANPATDSKHRQRLARRTRTHEA